MIRWMCLRLPLLSIERLSRSLQDPSGGLLALSVREGNREIVAQASLPARRLGVRPGQTVTAARTLVAALRIAAHDPIEDQRILERLATLLQRFTPDVVVESPGALMLETGRTASRFGGEDALAQRLLSGLERLGYGAVIGIAPTPHAARVLARTPDPRRVRCAAGDDPMPTLAPLGWQALHPPLAAAESCRALGIKTIGDLVALPRAAFAARFGEELLHIFDRLSGRRAEPLHRFEPPRIFRESLELWQPTDDLAQVLFAAKRLFDLAEETLEIQSRGLDQVELQLRLMDIDEPLRLRLRPSTPTSSARVFLNLIQHRLERESLPAPVESLHLAFEDTVPLDENEPGLFDDSAHLRCAEEAKTLRDRLAVRLGDDRVVEPELVEDHRPERAFRWRGHGVRAATQRVVPPVGARPIELLQRPESVIVAADGHGVPSSILEGQERGALRVLRGPERIANGWFDGSDVMRVYFEVETALGNRWWVFQNHVTGSWHRHGVFC